tara:strand:+ start:341 stop:1690 length:1350 start_codon:yes stop_codon:yes gene_type:complete
LVILQDLSQGAIQASLKEQLSYIEDERTKERDYMLDWYEGINIDDYVSNYFSAETLRQVPTLHQNLTKRVASLVAMTYMRAPRLRVDERYKELIDGSSLQAQRRLLERLTFLLGTMAFRSYWDERVGKIKYQSLSHFTPLFIAGDSRDEPVGVMYPIEYQGDARLERPVHAVWTADRPGQPGMHYLVDEHGMKISVNPEDRNPYGLLPITFCHRYPPIRDFYSGSGAIDLVSVDLAVNVAQIELSLAVRYGAMGIKYITNIDDASRVEIDVDKLLYLPQDSDLRVTSPGGSLSEIIESTRFLVESCLNNNHIRAKYARNDSGNAPSAASLAIIEMENMNNRTAMTEDTWRPWEHRRYEVDRRILQVEANADPGPDYSVDFLEPNYALTPESEIALWSFYFDRGLASPESWYLYKNPDASPEEIAKFQEQQEVQQQDQTPQNRLLNRLQS